MKKNIPIILIAVLLAFGSAWSADLKVHVINVAQADAILIVCPCGEHQLLIDAAELNIRYKFSDVGYAPNFPYHFEGYFSLASQLNNKSFFLN